MDTIQYLFSALIRLAVALFVAAIVWWLVSTLFPTLNARNLLTLNENATSSAHGDWLPAPRNGLFGNVKTPSGTDNVYQPGDAFNGYANAYNNNIGGAPVEYVTYTSTGTQIISFNGSGSTGSSGNYDTSVPSVRNLSIYQGGHLYTGLTFTGEARDFMFKNGKFPIVVLDPRNVVVTVFYAEALNVLATPGWVRFGAKITSVLPNKIPCTLVFEQAQIQYSYIGDGNKNPIRVSMPALCN